MIDSSARTGAYPTAGLPNPVHPRLASLLSELTYDESGMIDSESWRHLVAVLDEEFARWNRLGEDLVENLRGRSSFENLFRMSPIPLIEQDYTGLEEFMAELREDGVASFREYLGGRVESIRAVVPLIRIVAANPAAVRAVGLPLQELIGPISPDIVNRGSEDGWLTQMEAVWNREPEAQAVFTAATAAGEKYDAESILAAPLIHGEPDYSRALFTVIDITPHREERRRMQEMMEAKNRFLASVSHEIRTPLTAILGFGRLLDEDESLTADDRRLMISSIVQHSQEVTDLVEDLLVAARAESGQISVLRIRVNLMDQIEETLHAGGSFTIDVAVESQVEEPVGMGDPARVRQILRNLLTNAERYGGPNVTITIGVREGWLCVDVADNGPGLPDREWERIFEPYQRAHVNPGQPESVGIGLAISRQLAELMGGSLRYTRRDGLSVFRLCLPRPAVSG
ncbi:MAG: PAS domain-containing sensor histidine kinase [Actinobacteria bacterium]|nr:PAS domain-containing sensor histidine kinase [Actinomycetota bacterium]